MPKGFHESERVHAVNLLTNEGHIPEFALRRRTRLRRHHPASQVVIGLLVKIGIEFARAFHIPTAATEVAQPGHISRQSSTGRSTRSTARTSFSHRVVSWASCRRPAAVSL